MTAPRPVSVPVTPPYATFIPDRDPQFKTHKRIADAKNAVIGKSYGGINHDMTIYRLDGDQYVPWIEITAGSRREDYPDLAPKPEPLVQLRRRLARMDQWKESDARTAETHDRQRQQLAEEIARRERTTP